MLRDRIARLHKPDEPVGEPPAGTPPPASEGGSDIPEWVKDPKAAYAEIQKVRREAETERKRLKTLEDQRQADEQKALADQGKWKELAERRETELNDLKAQQQQDRLHNRVRDAARALKFNDPDDALVPAVLGKVKTDKDGNLEGIEEALKEYVAAKPYLIISTDGAGKPPLPGKMGVTNPANQPGLTQADLKKMTAQEIYAMDPKEVEAALTRK